MRAAPGRRRPTSSPARAERRGSCSRSPITASSSPACRRRAAGDRRALGAPERDPRVRRRRASRSPLLPLGNVVVGIQPARGYKIDPSADLPRPGPGAAARLSRVLCLAAPGVRRACGGPRRQARQPGVAAGQGVALSADCFPEAVLGPLPHLYPVHRQRSGRGHAGQAARAGGDHRHLMPPLTRAESYGPLAELERLVDEYYEAAGLDPRRLAYLRREILALSARPASTATAASARDDDTDDALVKLDDYLCELKEMQIRDGLHVFGASPGGRAADAICWWRWRAAARRGEAAMPRCSARWPRSRPRRLRSARLAMAEPWTGAAPGGAAGCQRRSLAHAGDTLERLELLARALVGGASGRAPDWTATRAVLERDRARLRPALAACGRREMRGLLRGLDGRFVAPGPSRRADARPARRAADRAQLLLGRHPRGADAGGLAARLEIGGAAGRALRAGARRLAARDRAVRLGHRQHAHRRRRHRAGAGAAGRAPGLGRRLAAGSSASRSCRSAARPAAGRRDAAHLRASSATPSRPDRLFDARCARWRRWTSPTSRTRSPRALRADGRR